MSGEGEGRSKGKGKGQDDGGASKALQMQVVLSRSARRVECAGVAFLRGRALRERGWGPGAAARAKGRSDVFLPEPELENDIRYLRSLDPRNWKDQDHYLVLGLATLRYNASDEQVKRAYRAKVLKHHPDKRRALGEHITPDTDYFTCITRAYEVLGTPLKRRSYDSIDPDFDDTLPSSSDLKKDFYATFGPQFDLNSRWSEKKTVPKLGDNDTPREQVEKFYTFWYDFDSWREYSYLDEEEKEKGQDREERRWIEKQNRAVRGKKKKEEMSRIRTLVDLAYNNDPRIVRFKQEDKDKKQAVKKARQDAAQARKAEEEKQLKEAQLAKEIADKEEKARADILRAEREIIKKNMKKERKIFRDLCKSNNYYISNDNETVDHMSAVEKICEVLKLLELQDLNKNLPSGGRQRFVEVMNETEAKLEVERKAQVDSQKDYQKQNSKSAVVGSPTWSQELIQLLIKSVNFFPAGTNQRWEVVANFVNQHGNFEDQRRFSPKDVLSKAKDLQSSDFSKSVLKVAANQEAFDKFEKEKRKPGNSVENTDISMSFDPSKVLVNGTSAPQPMKPNKVPNGEVEIPKAKSVEKDEKKDDLPWSKVEQELLEQAIKTYPVNTPERWDRIAECIPTRSKKECMKRFKELVDLVKAKKAASQKSK